MSSPGLTSGTQLRYLLQWFGEFSELQREDFLPVLAAASQGKVDQLAGILDALSCEDKPISLFQCRIKLFNEWFPTWSEEEQHRLVKGVTEIDQDFGKKLVDLNTNGEIIPKFNGDSNGNGVHSPETPERENTEVSHDDVKAEDVKEDGIHEDLKIEEEKESPEEVAVVDAAATLPVEIAIAS